MIPDFLLEVIIVIPVQNMCQLNIVGGRETQDIPAAMLSRISEDAAIRSTVLVPLNTSSTKQRIGVSSPTSRIRFNDLISTIK